MSPGKMTRTGRILAAVFVLLVSAGAAVILLFQRFGSIGDCNTTADCPSGKVCLTAVDSRRSLVRWIRPERSCQILCTRNSDCPPDEECGLFDDAFGPGAYCVPRLKSR